MSTVSEMATDRRRGRFALVLGVTLVRIPLAVALAGLLLAAPKAVWAALAVIVLIEVSDLADGLLARRHAVVSELGAALDPYCDSVSRLIVYWSLAAAGRAWWAVPLVMALRDVTTAYSRILLARRGRTVAAALSGKIKAVVQGAAALPLVALPWFDPSVRLWLMPAVSWAVIAVTAASAIEYVARAARVFSKDAA